MAMQSDRNVNEPQSNDGGGSLGINGTEALRMVEYGFNVLPLHYLRSGSGKCTCGKSECHSGGKHPAAGMNAIPPDSNGAGGVMGGCHRAVNDPKQIKEWWTITPLAHVGIATGRELQGKYLTVLDVDGKEGKVGAASLAALIEKYGPLPETLTVTTGSGWPHFYFLTPWRVHNTNNNLPKDIDVRGFGGLVVAPPSGHVSGGVYSWKNWGTPIADCPEWLLKLFQKLGGDKHDSVVDRTKDVLQDFTDDDKLEVYPKLTKQKILNRLCFIKIKNRDDGWWQVGAAIKCELGESGFEVWDTWSKVCGGKYSSAECLRQWKTFKQDGSYNGGTLQKLATAGGFVGDNEAVIEASDILENWVYIGLTRRWINRISGLEMEDEQFNRLSQMTQLFPKLNAADRIITSAAFQPNNMILVTYWPGKEEFVIEEGVSKYNRYKPVGIEPEEGDTSILDEQFFNLFPNEEERNILIDYLSYQVQVPDGKMHWSLILQGGSSVGKSYLGNLMGLLLGKQNVRYLSNTDLHENFTGWQKDCRLVVVEELKDLGGREIYNKLKPMITQPYCSIREMRKESYVQPNRFNFMFLTNHKNSLPIDRDDRRYCVLFSKANKQSKQYWKRLWNWTEKNIPAVLYRFRHHSLVNLSPMGDSPMTDGKAEMIEISLPALDSIIKKLVDTKNWPFDSDIVIPSQIPDIGFEEHGGFKYKPPSSAAIGIALSNLGYKDLGRMRIEAGSDSQVHFWIVRNEKKYRGCSDEEIRGAWRKQFSAVDPGPNVNVDDSGINLVKRARPL